MPLIRRRLGVMIRMRDMIHNTKVSIPKRNQRIIWTQKCFTGTANIFWEDGYGKSHSTEVAFEIFWERPLYQNTCFISTIGINGNRKQSYYEEGLKKPLKPEISTLTWILNSRKAFAEYRKWKQDLRAWQLPRPIHFIPLAFCNGSSSDLLIKTKSIIFFWFNNLKTFDPELYRILIKKGTK